MNDKIGGNSYMRIFADDVKKTAEKENHIALQ